MRVFILIAFTVFCYLPAQAQVDEVIQDREVLLSEYVDDMADTSKYEIYSKLAESYKFVDLDTTIKYGMLAESILDPSVYPAKVATAKGFSAWAYFMKGEYDLSLQIAEDAYALVEDLPGIHQIKYQLLHDQGTIYGAMGMYELGLRKFYEIIEIFDANSNEEGYYITLSNIGVMYMRLESYEAALEIFERLDEEMPQTMAARVRKVSVICQP